ncbi:MAG: hypothetical protein AAFO79_08775, partial [Pseudomonadota bacterium]
MTSVTQRDGRRSALVAARRTLRRRDCTREIGSGEVATMQDGSLFTALAQSWRGAWGKINKRVGTLVIDVGVYAPIADGRRALG